MSKDESYRAAAGDLVRAPDVPPIRRENVPLPSQRGDPIREGAKTPPKSMPAHPEEPRPGGVKKR